MGQPQDQEATGVGSPPPGAPPPSAAPARQRKASRQLLVSGILLVLIIGGLAWLVQFLPNWRKKTAAPAVEKQVVFVETNALWDPADPSYAMEFEHGEAGHYDYGFENVSSTDAELGLGGTSRDCSGVEVALLSPSEWASWKETHLDRRTADRPDPGTGASFHWQSMTQNDRSGIVIPGNAKGLVRMSWQTRKNEGASLQLAVMLWAQPQGHSRDRKPIVLKSASVVVGPLMFTSMVVPVGELAPGGTVTKGLFAWSATRSKLKVKVLSHNPLIEWQVVPLEQAGCRRLEQMFQKEKKNNTRVRSALRLTVTVREHKNEDQLPQGPFGERLRLRVDDMPLPGPSVSGRALGEVQIPALGESGKVNLGSFRSRSGAKYRVQLWTERGTGLALAEHFPGFRVKLEENAKDSTSSQRCWDLTVEIPRDSQAGPLPDNAAVILRTQSAKPRQIRIPVVGTAVQG